MDRVPCELLECAVLTAAQPAEIQAENAVLIAKIKRLLERWRPHDIDDPGNMGVFHDDFVAGWDGVRLKPPSLS